jgi:hypothetical protein
MVEITELKPGAEAPAAPTGPILGPDPLTDDTQSVALNVGLIDKDGNGKKDGLNLKGQIKKAQIIPDKEYVAALQLSGDPPTTHKTIREYQWQHWTKIISGSFFSFWTMNHFLEVLRDWLITVWPTLDWPTALKIFSALFG